ncbi:hypothetical protein P5673_008733 [Acropora cervicornis]|uniref:Uncharacterized protein n=1 Tax=Acropora cervicornis TaxID=6130 RepID=A0AAD9VA77_ACRCE|nr:hypothetical protein P5673_008733 [Acropora cervicornis]
MGSLSSKPEISEHEHIMREKLGDQLDKMQYRLAVTAKAHYKSTERYKNTNNILQKLSSVTGILGSIGPVYIPLTWKSIGVKYPLRTSIMASVSFASFVFTMSVKTKFHSAATRHQLHFHAGNDCRYLQRRVQFFAETDLWNPKVPWATLVTNYLNLLQEQKAVNSHIQTEEWAYRAALDKIEKREKEKRQKEREKQAEMDQSTH